MFRLTLYKILTLALLCLSNFSLAEEHDDRGFYFAPEVGYVLPTSGDVDDSIFLGGRFGYDFDYHWALELESGWMQPSFDTENGPQNVDVDIVPLLLNCRWTSDRAERSKLAFYLLGGLGGSFNDAEGGDRGDRVELDDSFVWQAGLGVDYLIGRSTTLFLDARYMYNEADVDVSSEVFDGDRISDDVDFDIVLFTTGVKF